MIAERSNKMDVISICLIIAALITVATSERASMLFIFSIFISQAMQPNCLTKSNFMEFSSVRSTQRSTHLRSTVL